MKILMLNNEFPPKGGGSGTVNQALLERFSQIKNLQIDLITSSLKNRNEQIRFADRIRIFKVPVTNSNIHHSSNFELLSYTYKALKLSKKLNQKNHYHLCFAWSGLPAGGIALVLNKLYGLRYIVRVSGPDIPGFEERYQWLYPLLTPIIRLIWRNTQVVITKCTEESIMIREIDKNTNVDIIPNGVDTKLFHPKEKKQSREVLRIICVARLIERKGQHYLIKAVKRLSDEGTKVFIELVGTGDAEKYYKKLVKSLGIMDLVKFSGYVNRESITENYASADVFVLPSFNEGMSLSTLEAMASGLPVVVTKTGGTNSMVEEGINGLVFKQGDINELTNHLRLLHNDKSLMNKMGKASRNKSREFSWEKASLSYQKLFSTIISQRPNQ